VTERPRVAFDTDLRRPRPAVLLRVVLAIPPVGALLVLSLAAALVSIVAWVVAISTGRVPGAAHRLLRAYVRYAVRVASWTALVTGRYPRVRGVVPPSVGVDRARQRRLSVLFRLVLALPPLVLATALAAVLAAVAIAAWFVALARGRTTAGLRELGAFCIRYQGETLAFLLLLTPRAPRLEPPSPAQR
jgi:hypothetical protein